jgi:hypothetical protein
VLRRPARARALRAVRRAGRLVVPVVAALLTTGCFHGLVHLTVHRDGSLDAEYRVGVFPALAGFVRDRMDQAAAALRGRGFAVSRYAEDRYVGFRAVKHEAVDVWRRPATVTAPLIPGATFRTEVRDGLFFRTLVGHLHVDLTNLKPSDTSQIIFTEDALQMVDVRVALTLPYRAAAPAAAVSADGKTVEWRLQPGAVTDVTVTAHQPRVRRIAACAAALAAIGLAIVWRGRARSAPRPQR